MNNSNLTQSILQQVADEKLKPKPLWQFLTKRTLVWFGVILSIIIGSISSSILFFLVINNDWEAYDSVTNNLAYFILLTLPYFWLIIFAGFIVLSYFYMRKTKHGYRYSLLRLATIYLALCILIGGTAYAYGGSEEIDRLLTVNVPIYKQIVNQQTDRWAQPQRGLIAGDVESLDINKKELILEDIKGNLWHVDYSKADLKVKLDKGEFLQLTGDKNEGQEDSFTAKKILRAKATLHKESNLKEINDKINLRKGKEKSTNRSEDNE